MIKSTIPSSTRVAVQVKTDLQAQATIITNQAVAPHQKIRPAAHQSNHH